MTDYTGSIHVSKYIRQGDDQSILDKIRVGDYLTVRGDVIFNRYDNDMAIDVAAIAKETAPQRQDTAEGDKRVELHLHTRYSTLDALTDPTAAVKTAARWEPPRHRRDGPRRRAGVPGVLARGGQVRHQGHLRRGGVLYQRCGRPSRRPRGERSPA